MKIISRATLVLAVLGALAVGCGDDGVEADRLGVGAQCVDDMDCLEGQRCLTQFKGGYCGLTPCAADADCPMGSACIMYSGDGMNYCFRVCADKPECNRNRDLENEANCSSSETFVEGDMGRKACIPPSGSTI